MTARVLGVALLLVLPLAVGGCNVVGDEYTETSLGEVLNGSVRSNQSRYKIPAPTLAAVRRNTGIIREESAFLVIVGPDLKKSIRKNDPGRAFYGVRLRKEPRTHVVLERIWRGDREVNLFEGDVVLRAEFPEFMGSSDVPFSEFRSDVVLERVGVDDTEALDGLAKTKVLAARLDIEPVVLSETVAAAVRAIDPNLRADKPQFVLHGNGLSWIIAKADVTTYLMLDFFLAEDRQFKGGVAVPAVFDEAMRNDTGIGGVVRVRWMDIGGTLFYRAR